MINNMITCEGNNLDDIPLNLKFDYDHREYELSMKTLEENLTITLQNNDEFYWENTFTEKEIIKENKNWNIYEFHEYMTFIHDSIAKKNFALSLSQESIELVIWLSIEMGQKAKKLEYQLRLIAKKYDKDLLVQRFLGYSKKFKVEIEEVKLNLQKSQEKLEEFQKFQDKKNIELLEISKNNNQDQSDSFFKGKIETLERKTQEIVIQNEKGWKEFYAQWDKFSENINKRIDEIQIENRKMISLLPSLKFSDTKTLNILHFSNQDQYSPTSQVLIAEAQKVGVTLNLTENRGNALNAQSQDLFLDKHGVLVSVWSSVNGDILGNLLAEYVDKGGNVVIVLFSCSTTYTMPKGRFDPPLIPKADDASHQGWKATMNNHLLLNGNVSVSAGSDKRRGVVELNPRGQIDLVAVWDDGVPMIAVRKDLKGIITTLGFQVGTVGSQDGLKAVVNALRLEKGF